MSDAPQFVSVPPWWNGYPPQRQESYHGNDVPARVQVAQDVLTMLTIKTMQRAAIGSVAVEVLDGQELLPVEYETQATACKMLTEYFRGELEPSEWEQMAQIKALPLNIVHICPECAAKSEPRKA